METRAFLKKSGVKVGDLVEATKGKTRFIGVIVPSEEPNILAIKLESGYNARIKTGESVKLKKIGKGKMVGKAKPPKLKGKKGLPNISILQIGGTIASRVDYKTGAVYTTYTPDDILALAPELAGIANISSRLVSNMFSEDMRFAHYRTIAREIARELKKNVAGIILPHGTDTMAFTASALAFMLKDIPVPVILVGAQRSADRGSTDAVMNLVCAVEFAAKTDFAGVAICMHESSGDTNCAILPPCKTRKLHTSRRDAFKAVNDTPIARVNFDTRKIEFVKKDYAKKSPKKKLQLMDNIEEKVALLKVFPNIFAEQVEFFEKRRYKGLVIEGTGLGHAPIGSANPSCEENSRIKKAIRSLVESGCVVVMSSQCLFGRIQMHVYRNGVELEKAGVIPGEDMLPETAFVKLAWLLGNFGKEKAKELIGKNLRGEINDRGSMDCFPPAKPPA
jgi:glutamyl-tRNA(Gln) amidotransferase subunit D